MQLSLPVEQWSSKRWSMSWLYWPAECRWSMKVLPRLSTETWQQSVATKQFAPKKKKNNIRKQQRAPFVALAGPYEKNRKVLQAQLCSLWLIRTTNLSLVQCTLIGVFVDRNEVVPFRGDVIDFWLRANQFLLLATESVKALPLSGKSFFLARAIWGRQNEKCELLARESGQTDRLSLSHSHTHTSARIYVGRSPTGPNWARNSSNNFALALPHTVATRILFYWAKRNSFRQ